MNRSIFGLVGDAGSGKGEIAKILQGNGFLHYSLSDTLRNIATSLGLTHERDILRNLAISLREQFGADILARGALRFIQENSEANLVIDSIRNPYEVAVLKQECGATIIGVSMPPEKQFELMLLRNRPGDPKTWDEFMTMKMRENGTGVNDVKVDEALAFADNIIVNDGTLVDLQNRTQEFLLSRGIGYEGSLPIK